MAGVPSPRDVTGFSRRTRLAELEWRLVAAGPPGGRAAGDPALRLEEAERRAELLAVALAEALAVAGRLRARAASWRRRLRASELARTAGSVRLAVTEAELALTRGERDVAHARAAELEAELARTRGVPVHVPPETGAAPAEPPAAPAPSVATALRELEQGELHATRATGEPPPAGEQPPDPGVVEGDGSADGGTSTEPEPRGDAPVAEPANGHGPAEARPGGDAPVAKPANGRAPVPAGRNGRAPAEVEADGHAPHEGGLRQATRDDAPGGGAARRPARLLAAGELARRLREQAQAAAAVPRPAAALAQEAAVQLDAAAAALRAPRPTPPPPAGECWLRRALVRLARSDPVAAGQILAGLLPAQGLAVAATLEYDLTIRGVGTYAVSLAGGHARVVALDGPRGRRRAEFHLRGEPLALAELLVGEPRRPGRLTGPLRLSGRRRDFEALAPLARAPVSLPDAVRAGADLAAGHLLALLPHLIAPEWTRGHAFTVALGAPGASGVLTVADGAPPTLAAGPGPADASVVLGPEAVRAFLLDERASRGARPVVRGNRGAVAALSGWLARARGRSPRPRP